MDIQCGECGRKASGTLGDLLVEGWVQKDPEHTPSRRAWLCPQCGVRILGARTMPRIKSIPPPPGKKDE